MGKENRIRKRSAKGAQWRRYEREGRSKKDNGNGKSERIILEHSGFKKKRRRIWDYLRQFEERSWEKIEKFTRTSAADVVIARVKKCFLHTLHSSFFVTSLYL
jgi:hypothetical protein